MIGKNATKRGGPSVCTSHKLVLHCHLVKTSRDMSFLCFIGKETDGSLRSKDPNSLGPQPPVWPTWLPDDHPAPGGRTWTSRSLHLTGWCPGGPGSRGWNFIPESLWTLRVTLPGQSLEMCKSLASLNEPVPTGHRVVLHLERFLFLVPLGFRC